MPAPPERLYEMYLDSSLHAEFTGAPVTIGSTPGAEFRAFGDMLSGRMLHTSPKRLIVQSWRAFHWKPQDLDSILILTFWPDPAGGRIDLMHVNVADHDVEGVSEGWKKYKRQGLTLTVLTVCAHGVLTV
ncbi:MAG: SRPBCC domain-containing protein [Burkholderiales bacterium]